ncbi:protein DEK-like [Physella acuta]|uniref:protein DEK-like n=1 Tax=Physella acuta TaxID=109671 RepID=UPI0027DB883B|nr:protein DEK-like [Physella acuta]
MADEEKDSKSGNEKPETDASEGKETKKVAEDDETKKETQNPKKDEKNSKKDSKSLKKEEKPKKAVKKVEKKEEKDTKEEDTEEKEDDESEEEEEELPPGLLEVPLVVEGKREKKKVERLSATMMVAPQEKKKVEFEEGSGVKLGDIPYIEYQINSAKAIDLKPLHRVLFLRPGTNMIIKKNIKQFSGFSHSKDSKEHEKRMSVLNKMVIMELKFICIVLGLERSGTKPNLVDRIEEFLMEPKDNGLKVKEKKSSKSGSKKKGTKRKRTSKGSAKKEKEDKDESGSGEDEDADEDDQEEEKEEEEEEEEEESEEEAPKKKKAKAEPKKTPAKKVSKENGKKEKGKKETKKPAAKKKIVSDDLSDSLSADSEDEPIAKIAKNSPPSNDEIKELVKKILDGADLETVTMKTVVKQVYAKYPSFDLSDRKDFIKDTVREVIS